MVDHSAIEPEFGSLAEFEAMAREVRSRGMGILLDVVPNHMGINDPGNRWWHDVLENGRLSRYAKNFDIDWDRLAENMRNRILLPTLGDHFGRELEKGSLQLGYQAGRFYVSYYDDRFPLAPDTWQVILTLAAEYLDDDTEAANQLHAIIEQLNSLPEWSDDSDAAVAEALSCSE